MAKKLGVALGVGFVKGMAHIGVLKQLDDNKININAISGSSMGALIGGLYASGFSAQGVENMVKHIEFQQLLEFVMPEEGLVSTAKIEDYLNKKLKDKTFDELDIPFYAVATNLSKGKSVVFNKGNVAKAISASIAFPIIFKPTKIGNNYYVDAGMTNPLPVDVVKNAGSNIIIASDVRKKFLQSLDSPYETDLTFIRTLKEQFIEMELENVKEHLKRNKASMPFYLKWALKPKRIMELVDKSSFIPPDLGRILFDSLYIMEAELTRLRLEQTKTDFLIQPDLADLNSFEFDKVDYCIQQGEKAAKKAIPKISRLLR